MGGKLSPLQHCLQNWKNWDGNDKVLKYNIRCVGSAEDPSNLGEILDKIGWGLKKKIKKSFGVLRFYKISALPALLYILVTNNNNKNRI